MSCDLLKLRSMQQREGAEKVGCNAEALQTLLFGRISLKVNMRERGCLVVVVETGSYYVF